MSARLYNGKWDGIWDKPKYQRIRQKIWDAFEGIEFIEESHQYFYKGQELIPTSNVCHLFRQPFDEDLMAQQCENKYFNLEGHKYYGMTKDEIIESWHQNSKRATTHGTSIHLFGENCAYFMMRQYDRLTEDFKARIIRENDGREYVESVEPKEEAIVNFWNDLPVSIIPIVFEIQMYSLKYGISGTADLLFLHDPHIELEDNDEEISQRLYLMDYKTNTDLYKAFDHMKEPFEEMLDNDLSGYKLQAAIYSYFLESHGFKFVSRALIWLRDLGDNRGGYEKVKMESLVEPLFKYLDTHPLKTLMHKYHY